MYHNHNFEFERLSDGRLLMEHLLDQLPAELMGITLDTYWVQAGGADIYQWLDILQDRIPCVHFKDMAVSGWNPIMAPVGDGNLNFRPCQKAERAGQNQIRTGRAGHLPGQPV